MRGINSRRLKSEEKKNIRRAFLYVFLTVFSLVLVVFLGLPVAARLASILTDLRQSNTPVEQEDNTPPAPPRLDQLAEATNEYQVEIKGTTEPGITVILTLNRKEVEVLSDRDGRFSYTFSLNDGENSFVTLARDSAGNSSQPTEKQSIIFDNQEPILEIISPEGGKEFFGSERQILIDGKTESGAEVDINGRFVAVEGSGAFTYTTTLEEGENGFTVKSIDKAGNETETSLTLYFSP